MRNNRGIARGEVLVMVAMVALAVPAVILLSNAQKTAVNTLKKFEPVTKTYTAKILKVEENRVGLEISVGEGLVIQTVTLEELEMKAVKESKTMTVDLTFNRKFQGDFDVSLAVAGRERAQFVLTEKFVQSNVPK